MPTTNVDNNNKALAVQAGKQHAETDYEWGCGSSLRLALLGWQVSAPGDAAVLVGLASTRSARDIAQGNASQVDQRRMAYSEDAWIATSQPPHASTFKALQGNAAHNIILSPPRHDVSSTTDHVKHDVPDVQMVTCMTQSHGVLAGPPATGHKQDYRTASLSQPDTWGVAATTMLESQVLTMSRC